MSFYRTVRSMSFKEKVFFSPSMVSGTITCNNLLQNYSQIDVTPPSTLIPSQRIRLIYVRVTPLSCKYFSLT